MHSLWEREYSLEFECARGSCKKSLDCVDRCVMRAMIRQCAPFVRHLALENVSGSQEFLTIRLKTRAYRTLLSGFSMDDLIDELSERCPNIATLFVNTKSIGPELFGKLLRLNKALTRLKMHGIHSSTKLDDYLRYLPGCLRRLDLFFTDCKVGGGLQDVSIFGGRR